MKKRTCRIVSVVALLALTLSLCACGELGGGGTFSNTGDEENGKRVWYLGGNNIMAGDVDVKSLFEGVSDSIDPAGIYASTEIDTKMLRGGYTLNNQEKDLKTVRKTIPFEEVTFKDGPYQIASLPIAVFLGAENVCCSETRYSYGEYQDVTDVEVAVLRFAMEEKQMHVPCTYEISGNKITFKQITRTSQEGQPLTYDFTGNEFVYDFQLSGPYLTFSKNGNSLKLTAYSMTENCAEELSMLGYSLPDSPLIDKLDYFASSDMFNYAVRRDGSYYDLTAYKLDDSGIITFYLAEKNLVTGEKDEFIRQYAYIIQCEADSFMTSFRIVLLDGEKKYFYTDDIAMREARALEEQGTDVGSLTEDQIKEIAEKKASLFDDLYAAFEAAGIAATINRSTGEIALDSTVMFDVGKSEVSKEGKSFLQKFMNVYASVVFSDKYEDFVSKIMVEGHTDTSGGYDLNKKLSQERAESVMAYCLSSECGIDAAYTDSLKTMMEAVGYAYDKPVYDENGEVDMDASRRVSFRFVVNIASQG